MTNLTSVKHKNVITFCVMVAAVMEVLDVTIANIALPHIQGALNTSKDQVMWVLTSYIVSSAVATPFSGWIACKIGIRQTLLVCITGFTISSILCGVADSLGQIVCFRLLQGFFGAALIPLSQSVLLDINPRDRYPQAMAIWGIGMMVAPILGPVIGGFITDTYNWRWIFFINVPVGIVAFFGILIFLPNLGKKDTRFDLLGFVLCSVFIFALQIMLDRGEQKDWFESQEIVTFLIIFIVAFIAFAIHSKSYKDAFIPVQLFADRNYLVSNIIIFFVMAVLYATLTIMPQFLQDLAGYDIVDAGILVSTRGIGTLFAMIIVGRFGSKINIRFLVAFGLTLMASASYIMTSINIDSAKELVIYSGLIQGFGVGSIFVPISSACFATISSELRPQATAVYSLIRNIGGSVGISVLTFITIYYTKMNHELLTAFLTPSSKNLIDFLQKYLSTFTTEEQIALLELQVTQQATLIGYINAFYVCMIITVLMIPLVFFLKTDK